MLELRPNCECCDMNLPPDSLQACICTYECTFCRSCVDEVLHNVCPNCGGGFVPRPIRPTEERRKGVSLTHQPASSTRVITSFSREEILDFSNGIKSIEPQKR